MKKIFASLFALILVATSILFLTACNQQEADVTSITVNPPNYTLTVAGQTVQLTANVVSVGGAETTVSWVSSNLNVATVSASGLVIALSNGEATITATSTFNDLSATARITVQIPPPVDNNIAITNARLAIEGANINELSFLQAQNKTQADIRNDVQTILEDLNLLANYGVNVQITSELFTAPIAGTVASPNGTDGSFQATITIARDAGITQTVNILIVITATQYDSTTADNLAINNARVAIVNANLNELSLTQEFENTQENAKAVVQVALDALNLVSSYGVTVAITDIHFTAAVAGNPENTTGINGIFTASITINRGNGTTQIVEVAITIIATEYNRVPVPPTIITTTLPTATFGQSFNYTLSATGDNPITWAIQSGIMPLGLTLAPNGEITGTPTQVLATRNVTFRATNDAGQTTRQLTFVVVAGVPSVPTNFSAVGGNTHAVLTWTAPENNGGSNLTRFEVSTDGITWTQATSNTGHTLGGLTNNTSYTIRVRAVNAIGNGNYVSVTVMPQESTWNGAIVDFRPGNQGDGTETNPWQISIAEHLAFLAHQVNSLVNSPLNQSDVHFLVTRNLYLNDSTAQGGWMNWNSSTQGLQLWTPIGNTSQRVFNANFDGGNFSIIGMFINATNNNIQGLFGFVGLGQSNITIQNINLVQGQINVNSTASTSLIVGGIIGRRHLGNSTLNNLNNGVNINIVTAGRLWIGGVVGIHDTSGAALPNPIFTINNSFNSGNITVTLNSTSTLPSQVGGIVGGMSMNGLLQNSRNTGNIIATNIQISAGGIAGASTSPIHNSHNTGTVSTNGFAAGGIVGQSSGGDVINSSNTGTITGGRRAGGIAGSVNSASQVVGPMTIANSFNTGNITATNTTSPLLETMAGGIVGLLNGGNHMRNSFSTGNVTGPSERTGGIAGALGSGGAGTVHNSYFLATATVTTAIGNNVGMTLLNVGSFNASGILATQVGGTTSLLQALNNWVSTNDIRYRTWTNAVFPVFV
ncbi:MAG: fibronectin type III domain-containing protein [Erysipelotrichales bacterium]|nr:fibronectin type III domain-containing protein [Erysipelotrichales bacterium]